MRSPGIALWGFKPGSAPPSARWTAGRGATVAGNRRGGECAHVGLGSTKEAWRGWAARIGGPIRWRPRGCPTEPADIGDWDVRAATSKTCGGGSHAEPTERAKGTAHRRAPRHQRLRAARPQGARDPTRTAGCPRRARDLPAASHARPRRGPTGLRGRARQRAPQRLGESGVRVLSLGGTCAPAWRFSSCYSVAI